MDGILSTKAVDAQQHLASLLSNKLKREYLEICGFVGARMSLAIVRFNTIFLCGARDKEACIFKIPYIADWAVMALLVL